MDALTTYEIGVARVELGEPPLGVGMMGWGMLRNVVRGSRTPLHARAFVLGRGESRVAMVCLDLAFVSIAVKQGVVERLERDFPELGLSDANVLLCATHTHSAPGGFTHYHFYNITIPGFVPGFVEQLVDATVAALVEASRRARPGRVRYVEGEFDERSPVARNRSVPSYNANQGIDRVPVTEPKKAVDRTMRMLRFEDAEGEPLGSINWFAVHATNVHSDNVLVHFDNKGYAAQMLEAEGGDGYVGAFAQGAAGDVTPNYKTYPGKPFSRGADVDDDVSARENGRLQFEQASKLLGAAAASEPLPGPLEHAHGYTDFSRVEVDPRYAKGRQGRRTGPAEIGWAMFFGTEEGPGLPRRLLPTQGLAQRARQLLRGGARRREIQGDKVTLVESGRMRVLGQRRLGRLSPAARAHPALAQLVSLDQTDRPDAKPWTPQILPVQILRIGPVAIVAVPAEFTTVAGLRLRASVAEALRDRGVETVVLSGYSNAYAGYVTTAEEYALQDYEGASTHFGVWTLAAYQTSFDGLADRLGQDLRAPRGPRPPVFTEEDLAGRVFR